MPIFKKKPRESELDDPELIIMEQQRGERAETDTFAPLIMCLEFSVVLK